VYKIRVDIQKRGVDWRMYFGLKAAEGKPEVGHIPPWNYDICMVIGWVTSLCTELPTPISTLPGWVGKLIHY
jgi:hypothetical protein